MRKTLSRSAILCVMAVSLNAQTLSLPKIDGITAFYRAGRLSAGSPIAADSAPPCDSGANALPMCGWGFETIYRLTNDTESSTWGAELAVGYDFLALHGKTQNGAYEIFGSVQTLPSITLYVSRDINEKFAAYGGIGTGLVVLKNVRAYDEAGRIYALTADAWGFTPSIGLTYEIQPPTEHRPGVRAFVEGAFESRDFSSVGYTLPPDVKTLPADLPRSLALSGVVVDVGFEITLPRKTETKTSKQ